MIEVLKRLGFKMTPTERALIQKKLLLALAYDRRLEIVVAVWKTVASIR